MTNLQKQYMKLSNRLTVCSENVTKYESGVNYNNMKKYEWQEKADKVIKEMNALPMTDEDFDSINEYYGC